MQTDSLTDVRALYEALLLPRVIEKKMLSLIRQGRIAKWFSGYGQEAIAVGVTSALREDDYILPMHRNLGVWTTRGVPLKKLFCQMMGKEGGFTRGRDRTFHFGTREHHIIGMISHLAAMLPVADGLALAAQLDGSDRVVAAFVGEGSTREGDFHEALSLASIWSLPVLFIVENNGYALSTPTAEAIPLTDIADAAAGYGMNSEIVDGNDLIAVNEAVERAASRARTGDGPTLLEMKTFRMRGHEEASGTKYIPDHLFKEWGERDPVNLFADNVSELLSENERDKIQSRLEHQIEDIAEWTLTQPAVVSDRATELSDVFEPITEVAEPKYTGKRETVRFIDAISKSLFSAMQDDDRVLIMGQDIAEYEGVFKVTAGFLDEFGSARVRNTPIIESGVVGMAMGLALEGWKPVVEIQYADFITCGFNQIVNNLATTRYRWGAPLGVTIRAPIGGGIGAGPFHSQSMEAWFCHVPGLKVVFPSTPEDAAGLLRSSIDDPNPVLYFEHKKLYRSLKAEMPTDTFRIPLGKARIARSGTDVTVVTYGVGVHWAQEVADELAPGGVSVEVIDLRTLIPWDRELVLASIRKTNRVLVIHEAVRTGGFGAEIMAEIVEEAFDSLDAAPVRIGAEDMPVPFSNSLEDDIYSARGRLREGLLKLLDY